MKELQAQVVNATLKDELLESRELRNQLIANEAVFKDIRVKALVSFLLPKDFGATTEQVANYFEVGSISAIKSLVHDNKDELVENGLRNATKEELSSLKELGCVSKNTSSIALFSRRTILNVAMLLRDSPVAKTIRSVLLDATENKTVVKEIVNQQVDMSQLSSSLQAFGQLFQSMVQMELNQKQIKEEVKGFKQEIQSIRDAVVLNPNNWREETTNLINKIATYRGGTQNIYQETRQEIYDLLENRFRVDLDARLRNLRRRMAEEGMSKSKRDKTNKLDVIANDPKLIEGYTQIVKEMAIKYGAA